MAKTPKASAAAAGIPSAGGNEEMQRGELRPSRLRELMAAEHVRLDALLARAATAHGDAEIEAYQNFRKGLLRHIGVEEKILFPAAQNRRGGVPLPLAGKLKLDHGALAALVMLPPCGSTFRALRAVLVAHNPLEDAPGGVYEQCESLVRAELDELVARCERAAEVPVSPWADSPKVLAAAKRVLTRAGYDPSVLDQ